MTDDPVTRQGFSFAARAKALMHCYPREDGPQVSKRHEARLTAYASPSVPWCGMGESCKTGDFPRDPPATNRHHLPAGEVWARAQLAQVRRPRALDKWRRGAGHWNAVAWPEASLNSDTRMARVVAPNLIGDTSAVARRPHWPALVVPFTYRLCQ